MITTNEALDMWSVAGVWDARWPEPFPVGVPVVGPCLVALWALRTFPLVGGELGRPVIRVGGCVFVLVLRGLVRGGWCARRRVAS